MTWVDFQRYAAGELLRRADAWDQTRLVVTMIHNVNCDKKNKQKTPEKLLPLWIDRINKAQNKSLTENEKAEMLNKIKEK